MELIKRLRNPDFLQKLAANKEVVGYFSPSGRITYNKVVSKRSFSIFTDIIMTLVPLDIVNNANKNNLLPSLARAIETDDAVKVYGEYFFVNATMEEYMDYETEEDQENMDILLEFVSQFPLKTPVVGICVQKSEAMGSAHATAFVVWKVSPKKYKYAYYDPLAHKKKNKSYDFAERAFEKSRFEQNIEFINLNSYCFHKSEDDFHCSQYIINAEYCYIYSAYFLYKWIEFGHKLHRLSFKKAIKSTYIVDPDKLTRVDNKESMIYRVVMMAFVCQILLRFFKSLSKKEKKYVLDTRSSVKRINEYLQEFKRLYGFTLI